MSTNPMKHITNITAALTGLALLGWANSVHAAVALQLQAGTPVAIGNSVQIPLYLTQTVGTGFFGTSTSGEMGISDAGLKVTRTSGDATISLATPNSVPGAGFDASYTVATPATASAATQASFVLGINNARTYGVLPTVGDSVLLGYVQIAEGNAASAFSITPYGSPNFTVTYNSIYNLDAAGSVSPDYQPIASSSFSVAAVPEPTAALGLVGMALFLRRKRTA